ncbi:uncharacterized protein MELLADRAFT_65094 [Melampsora larici-populina 98AG31]|uniref:Secreted protein n=1 Tax=Melampsora larici-populina (strain 98AG31 / pathotype 3-4-7) TaxID=747676 RepID=F4RTZ3_MELLP|nr:uncharacterized protein MELLADRAFT_65094 [Melampsora larici-populina 98AG31]EGG04175.1 hypothetical protein MELLADRAFT_65094 [Melampsora larici-populina 98AG31]
MHSSFNFLTNLLTIVCFISYGTGNYVSASAGPEASHPIRGIRSRDTRSLRARAPEISQENSYLFLTRSLNKRQGKLGAGAGGAAGGGGAGRGDAIIKGAVDRISAGLATTIAKFSALKDANLELPTAAEISEAMSKAAESVDSSQFSQALRAYKTGIDGLLDRKLAEGGKSGGTGPITDHEFEIRTSSKNKRQMRGGGGRGSPSAATASTGTATPSPSSATPSSGAAGAASSPPMSKDMLDGIAAAFLALVTKFVDAKSGGGRLPTGEDISQTLQDVIKTSDIKNRMETALAAKTALEGLADKMKTAK